MTDRLIAQYGRLARRWFPVGTRSLLFGGHQFLLHPWFVLAAWWRLFGFPWDPRLWVAFVIHDWGYWGKPNMDGPEGETHPEWAARVMARLFGQEWGDFTLLHSRYYSRTLKRPTSRLCLADKYAVAMTPWWVFVPLATLTGEITEYRSEGRAQRYVYKRSTAKTAREWHAEVQTFLRDWVAGEMPDQQEPLPAVALKPQAKIALRRRARTTGAAMTKRVDQQVLDMLPGPDSFHWMSQADVVAYTGLRFGRVYWALARLEAQKLVSGKGWPSRRYRLTGTGAVTSLGLRSIDG